MKILKAQPIRRQVIVGLAFALLPLVGALVWSGSRAREEREDEVRGEAKSVAATSASYLNQYLDGLDSLASALVRNPSVRALNAEVRAASEAPSVPRSPCCRSGDEHQRRQTE